MGSDIIKIYLNFIDEVSENLSKKRLGGINLCGRIREVINILDNEFYIDKQITS